MNFFSSQPDIQDFALADSFINFDYDPDSGSSSHVEEPKPEPEWELEPKPELELELEPEQEPEPELEPLQEPEPELELELESEGGNVDCASNIEEGFQQIKLVSESSVESPEEEQDIKIEDEEIVEENVDARNEINPTCEGESSYSVEQEQDEEKEDENLETEGINPVRRIGDIVDETKPNSESENSYSMELEHKRKQEEWENEEISSVSRIGDTSNSINPIYQSETFEPIELDRGKKNNDGEIEEGEIVDSDIGYDCRDDDSDDNVVIGDNTEDVHNSVIHPSVPQVNVTLESHHQMLPVGIVLSIVGAKVIVEGMDKHDSLNEGSILWLTESQTPLGLIDEIFGPVKNPYYIVRYNSENEVPKGVHERTLISFVPEFANYVLKNKDIYKKGCDASAPNDEELSDEADFSDDEKEAEYLRMQKMTKRGNNDQKHRDMISSSTLPVAPPPPLLDHRHCSPYSSIGRGIIGATSILPPFLLANAGPNLTVFSQPQSALLPNGFPTNGVLCFPGITQIPHQFLGPRIPFQQQLNPSLKFPPLNMLHVVHPNVFAQPMYAQGFVDQNQMTFGLSSPPSQQIQPHMNFQFSSIPGNQHAPQQFYPGNRQGPNQFNPVNQHAPHHFNPGSSARGRKTFYRGGRRGWRSSK